MIEVTGLSKRFGQVQALSDVSFTVEKGRIVGFLGANGAGKTTTMDIICGVIGADVGSAKIGGFDITEQPIEAKKRLGYLPDSPPLHLEMRVEDFIAYAAKIHKVERSKVAQRVDDTIGRLSLGDVRHRVIGNLSKGFRQRVALAQAIVHEPEVLVLDEPTEGLDPVQIAQIRELIRSLAGEHTIILSSHILSEVQNTCEQIIILHQGRIVEQGSYDEVVMRSTAGRLYRMRVGREAARLAQALTQVHGLQGATAAGPDDCELELALAPDQGDAALDEIVQAAIRGGHGLRELAPKSKSLEDVFFQITK